MWGSAVGSVRLAVASASTAVAEDRDDEIDLRRVQRGRTLGLSRAGGEQVGEVLAEKRGMERRAMPTAPGSIPTHRLITRPIPELTVGRTARWYLWTLGRVPGELGRLELDATSLDGSLTSGILQKLRVASRVGKHLHDTPMTPTQVEEFGAVPSNSEYP